MVCVGLVLGSPALRPVSWRVWAGAIEREGEVDASGARKHGTVVNPFGTLEDRVGFWDVRVSAGPMRTGR